MKKKQVRKLGSVVLASTLVLSPSAPTILAATTTPAKADVSSSTGRTDLEKTTGITTLNPIPARVNNASTVKLSGKVVIDGPKLELKVNGKIVNAQIIKLNDTTWTFEYEYNLNPDNLAQKKDETITVEAYTVYQNGKTAGAVHTLAKPVTQTVDLTPPDIIIADYSKDWTNQSITVNASINEEGTMNARGHTFDENGSFTFTAKDKAGNTSEKTVTIDNIDKVAPEAKVTYSTTSPINTDVVATIAPNDTVTYTNIDELPETIKFDKDANTLTFSENGSFELKFVDKAGNPGSVPVSVQNIDKEAPVGSLTYSTTDWTNQDVTATLTTTEPVIFENLNLPDTVTFTQVEDLTYNLTFTENETVNLNFVDAAGNKGTIDVNVATIDKVAPTAVVNYSTTKLTNQDVVVTIDPSEEVTILNNEGSPSITFTENGTYEFMFVDKAGNTGAAQVSVQNIDKVAPEIMTGDYSTDWTNQDITVTASMSEEGTLNETSHTFTENGSFTFVATDLAGNITRHTVQITNIDKRAPEITVRPYNTNWTNQDITVEVTMDEEGTLNTQSHTFTENGDFTFIATDRAGNITKKVVTISNIDKVAPEINVNDYVKSPTNHDITVNVSMNEPGTLNQESYTFTKNDEFEFVATDLAGNVTTTKVTIDNIDKVAPVITVLDYNTNPTNQDVIVTASTNEGTLNTTSHTFTENGTFNFVATDAAGNETIHPVTITNIDKTAPVITVDPYNTDPTNGDVVVTVSMNEEGTLNTTSHKFTSNGEFEFVATDLAGNVTRKTVKVSNIVKTPPTVSGIINGSAYNTDVTPTFNKGTATLNGQPFTSGTKVSAEGSYTLIVTDGVGNSTTVSFTIDKTAPKVSGVVNNQYYNVNVTPSSNEGTATLNGNTFLLGTTITSEGFHTLVVRDAAGNQTTVSFTVDKTAPSLAAVTASYIGNGQDRMITVSGSAEPGASIVVYQQNAGGTKGDVLTSGTADSQGHFSFAINTQGLNLIVTATDKANNTSETPVKADK
ncbi:Ig-like domain-containing protein [Neobacillus pocheonensis]|uniref:Ig-like domain-containing protein n=1 Tax=Neobacillus pocheonensis TaxID=363869 RepID=UPI003D29FFF9